MDFLSLEIWEGVSWSAVSLLYIKRKAQEDTSLLAKKLRIFLWFIFRDLLSTNLDYLKQFQKKFRGVKLKYRRFFKDFNPKFLGFLKIFFLNILKIYLRISKQEIAIFKKNQVFYAKKTSIFWNFFKDFETRNLWFFKNDFTRSSSQKKLRTLNQQILNCSSIFSEGL